MYRKIQEGKELLYALQLEGSLPSKRKKGGLFPKRTCHSNTKKTASARQRTFSNVREEEARGGRGEHDQIKEPQREKVRRNGDPKRLYQNTDGNVLRSFGHGLRQPSISRGFR